MRTERFVASDFAITGVQAALEEAGKWAPAGQPNHFWLATQDLNPPAVPLMQQGYIDVATTYDAFKHAEELVRVAIALKKGEDSACGPDGCLAKGRVVTPLPIKERSLQTGRSDVLTICSRTHLKCEQVIGSLHSELTVHWGAPATKLAAYLQTRCIVGDEVPAVAAAQIMTLS